MIEPMKLPEPFESMLARAPQELRVGVVGASNDARKFGSIIFRAVRARGSLGVQITPSASAVDEVPTVASVTEAATQIDFANFVIPPARTLEALRALPAESALPVWFQPGSYDDEVLAECKRRGLPTLVGPCILVELAARG
jgi:predicted CoA-binding protein